MKIQGYFYWRLSKIVFVCFSWEYFFGQKIHMLFFYFQKFEKFWPHSKTKRWKGRERNRAWLLGRSDEEKKKKIKSFLRLEDKTSREEIGQGLHNYIFLHRATSLQSSPLPLPQARFDLRYLCLPFWGCESPKCLVRNGVI